MRDITVYSKKPRLNYKVRNLVHKLNFIRKLLNENSEELERVLNQIDKKSGRNARDLDGMINELKKIALNVASINSTMVSIKVVYSGDDDGGSEK